MRRPRRCGCSPSPPPRGWRPMRAGMPRQVSLPTRPSSSRTIAAWPMPHRGRRCGQRSARCMPARGTRRRRAQFLIDTGDHAEAAAYLAEAREVLVSLPDGAQAQQARLNRLDQQLPDRTRAPKEPAGPLTEREEAVLRLLRSTLSLREIGQELFLSTNTIKTHTRAIYRKLGATTRAEAVERAYEAGLLP